MKKKYSAESSLVVPSLRVVNFVQKVIELVDDHFVEFKLSENFIDSLRNWFEDDLFIFKITCGDGASDLSFFIFFACIFTYKTEED